VPKNSDLSREELERSKLFLDSLIEHLPIMVFVKDAAELRFVHFNRAGEKLLGLGREALLGKNDYDFFPREQADFFTSKDRAVLKSGELTDIPEEPISTQSGLRYLHTRKIPLMGEDGKAAYLLGISEDITQRKAAEEELLKSQTELRRSHSELEQRVTERTAQLNDAVQARDEFISIASHELKTPLTPLKLQIQSILRNLHRFPGGIVPSEQVSKLLKTSDRQIRRLTHLIDDLLDVSRITAGKLSLRREQINLNQLVRETVDSYAEQLAIACSPVSIDAPEPVAGFYDQVRIEQVIGNLVTNAMKYAPGGAITIRVQGKKESAIVSIEDQGPGIPADQIERIFSRFERGASRVVGGLGLGLYISRQIVEAHGGTIYAETRDEGGARFVVTLPRESDG
jgi:PAS domain S-box-containing protein